MKANSAAHINSALLLVMIITTFMTLALFSNDSVSVPSSWLPGYGAIKQITSMVLLAMFLYWLFVSQKQFTDFRNNQFCRWPVGGILLVHGIEGLVFSHIQSPQLQQYLAIFVLSASFLLILNLYWHTIKQYKPEFFLLLIIIAVAIGFIEYSVQYGPSTFPLPNLAPPLVVCLWLMVSCLFAVGVILAQRHLANFTHLELIAPFVGLIGWVDVTSNPGELTWWAGLFVKGLFVFSLFLVVSRINRLSADYWLLLKKGLAHSTSGFFCADVNQQIIYANKEYLSLFTLSKNKLAKHHPLDNHPIRESVLDKLNVDKHWQGETVVTDNHSKALSVRLELFQVSIGQHIYNYGYVTNLDQAVAEQQQHSDTLAKLEQLSFNLMDKQEEERRYFAKELHDEIGQGLTLLKIQHQLPEPDKQLIKNILTELIDKVRNLSLNLRPSILDDMGLSAALLWLSERQIRASQLAVTNQIQSECSRLDEKVEISVFRIAQEAFTNIHKYSHADHVNVTFSCVGSQLILVIEDNGIGFDVDLKLNSATQGKSLGLLGIQERAFLINGQVDITSTPEQGTRISLTVPVTPRQRYTDE